MDPGSESTFKHRLDQYYDWPCAYLFKFIAPQEKLGELVGLFADEIEVRTRSSRQGNYVSVTAEVEMASSDAVMEVYRRAGEIGGVMPL